MIQLACGILGPLGAYWVVLGLPRAALVPDSGLLVHIKGIWGHLVGLLGPPGGLLGAPRGQRGGARVRNSILNRK